MSRQNLWLLIAGLVGLALLAMALMRWRTPVTTGKARRTETVTREEKAV